LAPEGDDDERRGASFFGPHYDGPQCQSAVRDGQLIDDEPVKGVTRLSQM
jgi:hypothetical protein